MDMTHPSSGHDKAEDPIKINHPEEEEHHESGASKMLKRVKARAKKFKNTLTKHDTEPDHDVEEEDDEIDEQELENHSPTVSASSAVRGGVTGQPSHPRETNVPAPGKIIPPKTEVSPVVSSGYPEPVEPAKLRDASYGHEALPHSVRTTDKSDREEKTRDAPAYPVTTSDLPDIEENREARHEPLNTHVPLLSTTEDVTGTFAPGQREVDAEKPKRLEDDLSVEPSDQLKVSEEKEHGEAVAEEGNGGGMVEKIKGAYNYWLGGTTEEVKPKSPVSVEESSQSLGSTVGTKGFPESGETGLGETGSGTGAVPAQKGLRI